MVNTYSMMPKLDINTKFFEKRDLLLEQLSDDLLLPVTNIELKKIDHINNTGQFSIEIDKLLNYLLTFTFNNNEDKFHWDTNHVRQNLDWNGIYDKNKEMFNESIYTLLKVNKDDIDKITTGKNNMLYFYTNGSEIPSLIICEFSEGVWNFSERKF